MWSWYTVLSYKCSTIHSLHLKFELKAAGAAPGLHHFSFFKMIKKELSEHSPSNN